MSHLSLVTGTPFAYFNELARGNPSSSGDGDEIVDKEWSHHPHADMDVPPLSRQEFDRHIGEQPGRDARSEVAPEQGADEHDHSGNEFGEIFSVDPTKSGRNGQTHDDNDWGGRR